MKCNIPNPFPRRRFRNRQGRCYELCYSYLMTPDAPRGWRLIHGEICDGTGKRIGHAWLANDDYIFDPVIDCMFFAGVYFHESRARMIAEFSPTEAACLATETKHYGPWHDEKVIGAG